MEEPYNQFVTKIKQNASSLSRSDLRGFYSIAGNYLADQMKKGVFKYEEFLALYKEMDKQNLFIENKYFPIVKLKNVIIVACNCSDLTWAKKVLDDNILFVKKSIQKDVYHLNTVSYTHLTLPTTPYV